MLTSQGWLRPIVPIENGNKAAGTRARKASLEIEKAMKEFRKASLEASKN